MKKSKEAWPGQIEKTYLSLELAFNSALSLLDFRKTKKTLESCLPHADLHAGILGFLGAIALVIIVAITLNEIFAYILEAIYADGVLGVETPQVVKPAAEVLFFNGAIVFIMLLAVEWLCFQLARKLGGKGTLEQQVYLSSMVMLAIAMTSYIMLLTMFPCVGMIVPLIYIVLSLYIGLYVRTKAFMLVHSIGFWKAFVIVLLGTGVFLALTMTAAFAGVAASDPGALIPAGNLSGV